MFFKFQSTQISSTHYYNFLYIRNVSQKILTFSASAEQEMQIIKSNYVVNIFIRVNIKEVKMYRMFETKCLEIEQFYINKIFNGKLNNNNLSNLCRCILIIDEINCKIRDKWTKNNFVLILTQNNFVFNCVIFLKIVPQPYYEDTRYSKCWLFIREDIRRINQIFKLALSPENSFDHKMQIIGNHANHHIMLKLMFQHCADSGP